MDRNVTWGILGTGDIARQMAEDLRLVQGAELRAVASRNLNRARAFAETHGIPEPHGDYASLAADPAIDVVYVATPHPRHCADALLCLEHGKGVLCEKPLAMNLGEVDRMIDAAESSGSFLMEAMWTAFFPAMIGLRGDIAAGRIGDVRLVMANFSYKAAYDPASRLFDPHLGGGALLDIGVYPIALADMVFGREPESIHTAWTPTPTGVDASAAIILDYGGGQRALLNHSLAYDAPQEAIIAGDSGTIRIPEQFSQPDRYLIDTEGALREHDFERKGFGYHLEAAAVTACVRDGDRSCATVPWSMSRRIARTLDRVRGAWGLTYPMEQGVP